MKKYTWLIILVIVLIVIGGFVYFSKGSKPLGTQVEKGSSSTQKNIFTSIKDAMTKSLSLKCEYQGEHGKTTTYLKGNNVRVMYQALEGDGKSGHAIMKDNQIWIWTEGEKEGLVFNIEESDKNTQEPKTETNREQILDELEKYKNQCSAAVVSDSMFTPPSGVDFKDMSSFQQEMMKNLNVSGIPEVPTEASE